MKTVLILGSTGMLGAMVTNYFRDHTPYQVTVSSRTGTDGALLFDAQHFNGNPERYSAIRDFDYLINCIGVIKPYCKDNDPGGVLNAVQVNALFPHNLARFVTNGATKVIQIATDCVFSGSKGKYIESDAHDALDVYGKSKSLGEVFYGRHLNIRCSIIGPEPSAKVSLLEWYLGQKPGQELNGFDHHSWNGVTTLQYARLCDEIIANSLFDKLIATSHTFHYTPNTTVTKYELLQLFNEVFERTHPIRKVTDIGPPIDRSLATQHSGLPESTKTKQMTAALEELNTYMKGMKH